MRYWKRVDAQGKTKTVESYTHNLVIKGAIEIDKNEFDTYIASLPPSLPARNLESEFDQLKQKVQNLESEITLLKR